MVKRKYLDYDSYLTLTIDSRLTEFLSVKQFCNGGESD